MTYLFIDTETGGLDPNMHSLLTFAAIATDDDFNELQTFSCAFKCELYHVSAQALRVNNLDIRALYETGVMYSDAHAIFAAYPKTTIAGWNVQFDKRFVEYWIDPPQLNYRTLDVQSVFRFMYPQERGSLADAARIFNLPVPDHTALADVSVTLAVARELKKAIGVPMERKTA